MCHSKGNFINFILRKVNLDNILKIIIIPHIIKDPETNSQIFFVYKSRFCEMTQWAKFC